MKKDLFIFLSLFLALNLYAHPNAQGYLFIIGGGHRSESMMKKYIELTKKFNRGKIVIFPMASSAPQEVGPELVEEFTNLGAQEVEYHILDREQATKEEYLKILDDVGGVYFSGGVQSRLTDILVDTQLHHLLLEIYRKGAVIGGTSAGAAVMSKIMIVGEEKRRVEEGHAFEVILADNIVTSPGFGFIDTAIIDQHFVTRKRHNRLISLIIEHPELLGIGIDESTAIIVKPDETFEVVGEKNVIIYDPTQSTTEISSSHSMSGFNIIMHILKSGDQFDLKAHKILK